MGLTVLASPDPLLQLLAPPGTGTPDAAPPDAFQALLAELLGQAPTDSGVVPSPTTDALPLPATKPKDSDATDSAAVLEAMAALQPLAAPVIPTPLPEAQAGASDSLVSGIGSNPLKEQPEIAGDPSQAAPTLAEAAPGLQDAPPGDAVDAPPAPAAGDAPAAEQPAQPRATQPAPAPTEAEPQATSTPATTPPIDFKAVLEARTQKLEHHEKRAKGPDDDAAAPPGDPPPTTSQPPSSVVRSVGNAHENKADDNNGNAFGRQEQKPQPKASVEGIAHSSEHSILHRTETADVSAPDVPPQQPVRPELPPAVEQLARTVIEKVDAGGGEAKLHLHPAELGEITIHVHADGDHVQVHIHADRPEAAQLLREHTVDLSSMLGQQGLNLADVNVSLGQPGSGNANSGEQQPAPNRPGNSDFAALMGIGDTAATDRFNRVRAAYNPNGAFDYRI